MCCRICLLQNCKMLSIESRSLRTAYEQLTGVSVEHDDGLPRELCVECATLLDKYHKFRKKSIRGNTLLRDIYCKVGILTPSSIYDIDRIIHKLNSNISQTNTSLIVQIPSETSEHSLMKETIKPVPENNQEDFHNNTIEFTNVENYLNSVEIKNEIVDTDIENNEIVDKSYDKQNITYQTDDSFSDEDLYTKSLKIKKEKLKRRKIKKIPLKQNKTNSNVNDDLINECFDVKYLSSEEQKQSFEERKLSDKFLNAAFKCEICFKGFSTEFSFSLHMKKHDKESGDLICDICHQRFRSRRIVNGHSRCTHQFRYECKHCPNVHLASRSAALGHAKWHQGKKYTCDLCGAVFEWNTTYLSHVRIKHPSDAVCAHCGYSFLGDKGLTVHVHYKHSNEAQVPISGPWCRECDIQFSNEQALAVHNGIKHTDSSLRNDTPRPSNCAPQHRATKSTVGKRVFKKTSRKSSQIEDKCDNDSRRYLKSCQDHVLENADFHETTGHTNLAREPENEVSKLWCDTCEFQFSNDVEMRQHQIELHGGSNEESTTNEADGSSGKKYTCEECGIIYEIYTSYLSHVRIKHPSLHVCVYCGYSYVSQKGLELHTTYRHYTENTTRISGPWCEVCDIQFSTSDALQVHTGIKHGYNVKKIRNSKPVGEKSSEDSYNEFQCDIKPTSNGETLNKDDSKMEAKPVKKKKRGVIKPKQKIPGPCEVCGVSTRSFREYGIHFRRAHPTVTRAKYPGTCICDKCGRKFTCYAVLRDHMLIHGEVSKYKCTECPKTFKTLQQLKNHCLIHQTPSHECPICHLKYNHSGNRNRHMKQVHSDIKPYQCDFCEKRFKTDCDKKIHMKHIHLKEPWPKRNRNGPKERQRQTFVRYRRRKETEQWSFEQAENGVNGVSV